MLIVGREAKMRALSVALLVLFCCFLSPGFAQTGTPVRATTPANTPASLERGASRRVTLDVVVMDKHGTPVFGLQQADFTLLDDKQPQAILSFEAHGGASTAQQTPVQVVLVVDALNLGYHCCPAKIWRGDLNPLKTSMMTYGRSWNDLN